MSRCRARYDRVLDAGTVDDPHLPRDGAPCALEYGHDGPHLFARKEPLPEEPERRQTARAVSMARREDEQPEIADLTPLVAATTSTSDPRIDIDILLTKTFNLLLAADGRNFTADELDQLVYDVTRAGILIKKLPGGLDAIRREKKRVEAELARRKAVRQNQPVAREHTPTDAVSVDNTILGKAIASEVPLEEGGTVNLRLRGLPNGSPLYVCSVTGKLLRTPMCPLHPDAGCAFVGYDDAGDAKP